MPFGEVKLPSQSQPDDSKRVQVTFNPVEDPEETYLYADYECAISSMAVLPLYRSSIETLESEVVSEIETATSVSSGDLLVMSLRNSPSLFLHF